MSTLSKILYIYYPLSHLWEHFLTPSIFLLISKPIFSDFFSTQNQEFNIIKKGFRVYIGEENKEKKREFEADKIIEEDCYKMIRFILKDDNRFEISMAKFELFYDSVKSYTLFKFSLSLIDDNINNNNNNSNSKYTNIIDEVVANFETYFNSISSPISSDCSVEIHGDYIKIWEFFLNNRRLEIFFAGGEVTKEIKGGFEVKSFGKKVEYKVKRIEKNNEKKIILEIVNSELDLPRQRGEIIFVNISNKSMLLVFRHIIFDFCSDFFLMNHSICKQGILNRIKAIMEKKIE